jgi:hypothetical protein
MIWHHPEVEQVGDGDEQRRLMAAVPRRRRREGATYLAMEGSLRPSAASLVEEACDWGRHPAKARAGANNDCVVLGDVVDARDWGGLAELVVG